MDRKEIITQIDRLRDELLKLDAKDTMLSETIAYCATNGKTASGRRNGRSTRR